MKCRFSLREKTPFRGAKGDYDRTFQTGGDITMELPLRGHQVKNQDRVVTGYKHFRREEPLRFDLLIDRCLFVEVKAVEKVLPIHQTQLLSYMKLLDIPLGWIIHFHALKLTEGVSRFILPGANQE